MVRNIPTGKSGKASSTGSGNEPDSAENARTSQAKKTAGRKTATKKTPPKKTATSRTATDKTAAKKAGAKNAGSLKSTENARGTESAKGAKGAKSAQRTKTGAKAGTKTGKPSAKAPAAPSADTGAQLPLPARILIMLVAFAAMVGFAVVLSKLTLEPSAASKALTHNNLRPGDSIRAYLQQPAIRDTVKQLGGNIVLGMPFGVLLPVLWPRSRGLLRVMLATAAAMLLVELVQGALIEGRAFDIDDVILNTAGSVVGYLLLGRRLGRAVHPRRTHWWHRLLKRPAPE